MTIEATLERIANALETIAAGGGFPTDAKPAEKKPDQKASKPPAKDKKQTVGKVHDEAEAEHTKEEVRAKLQAVQKKTTPAQAKSILKAHGASTIGNLAVSRYAQVMADCDAVLDE